MERMHNGGWRQAHVRNEDREVAQLSVRNQEEEWRNFRRDRGPETPKGIV